MHFDIHILLLVSIRHHWRIRTLPLQKQQVFNMKTVLEMNLVTVPSVT